MILFCWNFTEGRQLGKTVIMARNTDESDEDEADSDEENSDEDEENSNEDEANSDEVESVSDQASSPPLRIEDVLPLKRQKIG